MRKTASQLLLTFQLVRKYLFMASASRMYGNTCIPVSGWDYQGDALDGSSCLDEQDKLSLTSCQKRQKIILTWIHMNLTEILGQICMV